MCANPKMGVSIIAKLLSFDPEHPWSDNHEGGHDDGVAPLGTFIITAPACDNCREFSILFKYSEGVSAELLAQGSREHYSMTLPCGFVEGSAKIIDNTLVTDLEDEGMLPDEPGR